ncbi:conserved repeat domain-containing protein, partial [Pseudarcicella hirudinis]
MKRTSTFSDGNNNMKDLTFSSLSQKNTSDFVLGSIVMLVGKIYKKIYAFAAQPSGGEFISSEQSSAYQNENPVLVEQNRNPIGLQENLLANTSNNNSPAAPFHSSILYPQNVKQMNFFTYLRRAFESSESTLKSHELKNTFLRPFRDLLSVIVGLTSDVNFLPDLSGKNTYALSLSSKTRSSFNKFSGLLLSGLFMVFAFGFSARAQNPHLKLKKTIVAPQAKYAIGDEVVYNVKINNKGNAQATGVEVTDNLPAGVQFVSTSIVRGSGGYSDATKIWSVGTLVNGDSAIIEIKTKVIAQGVWFNVAEVTHENEIDQASTPNNHVLTEDDQDAVCFTVPLYIYDGEEYAVGLPAGYTNTTWYKDGSIITPSTQGAFVRNDSLFITAAGIYNFTTSVSNCPANGCCNIIVENGPCQNAPTVAITPVAPVCAGDVINLTATIGGSATGVNWSSSSSGTSGFTSTTGLTTTYTPSAADTTAGTVTFTVITDDPDGPNGLCTPATATRTVIINKKPNPILAVTNVGNNCPSVTANLVPNVTASTPGGVIEFHTSNDTTRASLVSNATAVSGGTYYVFEISSSKCVSIGKPITVTITPCNCANPATIVISPVSPICAGGLI